MFLQVIKNFLSYPTHSRTLSILGFLVILAAIPLTVFIAQQQQEIRQRASEETGCPDQCFSDELRTSVPKINDACDSSYSTEIYKCPGAGENTATCGDQPWYCDGYWKPGVRPQPTEAPPAPTAPPAGGPTNPPEVQPTAAPTPTRPPAQLQKCSAEGYNGFCADISGQFPPNQQLACGTVSFTRASSGDSSCTNKNYPACHICPLSDLPKPTSAPTKPQPTATQPGPTATSAPAPAGTGPTATLTPSPAGGPTGTRVAGDINGDGQVNIQDYTTLASCYGNNMNKPSCGTNKTKADLNNDGKVDGVDYNILIRNFGK